MNSIAAWIGVIAGIAAAAQVAATISRRIRRVRQMHQDRLKQVAEASRHVRERAKATLDLRREERAMQKELRDLTGHIDTGEETVQKKKSSEALIHVLDERRGAGDQAFVVPVRHPRFADIAVNPPKEVAGEWARGRRYMVWGPNAKTAAAKAAMRFPPDKGYGHGAVEPYAGNTEDL